MTLEQEEAQYQADLEANASNGSCVPVIKMERKANVGFLQFIPLPIPTVGLPADYTKTTRYEHPVGYNLMWDGRPQYILDKRLYQLSESFSAEDSSLYDEVVKDMRALHNYEYHVSTAVKEPSKSIGDVTANEKAMIDAFMKYEDTKDWSVMTQSQAEVYRYLLGKQTFTSYTSGYNTDTFMYGYVVDTDIAKFKNYKGAIVCILFINKKEDNETTFHSKRIEALHDEDKERQKKGEADWLAKLQSSSFEGRTMSLKVQLAYAINNAYYTVSVKNEDAVNIPEERQTLYLETNWVENIARCKSLFDRDAFSSMRDTLKKRLALFEGGKESAQPTPSSMPQQPVEAPKDVAPQTTDDVPF